jgi:hypothetical protein
MRRSGKASVRTLNYEGAMQFLKTASAFFADEPDRPAQ